MNEPVGADVYFKDYADVDGPWTPLGRVPIKDRRIPMGELRWRLVKDGFDTTEGSSAIGPVITLRPTGQAPPGMVFVRGGRVGYGATTVQLPDFWIDKYEVTNREFKRFVDAGGYRESKYWKAVVRPGSALPRQDGPAGPATWELGTFPDGQADYPVSGVSWYEAAAYAEFAGKRLPTIFHGSRRPGTCCSARSSPRWLTSTASRPNR
jgi:hypothetical protein